MAKFSNKNHLNSKFFEAGMTATFKYIGTMSEGPSTEQDLYSVDTGQHESPFQGRYFDMNADLVAGRNYPVIDIDKVDLEELSKLVLKPFKDVQTNQEL